MKVIAVDNFDRDNVDDVLVQANLPDETAYIIAAELNNAHGGNDAPRYYRAVPDDYKLREFEP